jgi:hypothetical protein
MLACDGIVAVSSIGIQSRLRETLWQDLLSDPLGGDRIPGHVLGSVCHNFFECKRILEELKGAGRRLRLEDRKPNFNISLKFGNSGGIDGARDHEYDQGQQEESKH